MTLYASSGQPPKTGDSRQSAIRTLTLGVTAGFLSLPVIEDIKLLEDANSELNTARLSGKRLHAGVMLYDASAQSYTVYLAQGDLPLSLWVSINGGTTITPTGKFGLDALPVTYDRIPDKAPEASKTQKPNGLPYDNTARNAQGVPMVKTAQGWIEAP